MDFALDCSVVLSWCFKDEFNERANKLQASFLEGAKGIAPSLLQLELINSLLIGQRRKRISKEDADLFIQKFFVMPLEIESNFSTRDYLVVKDLAEKYALTAYDATYLELAIRKDLPLATLDKALAKAAKKAGVKCLV